MHQLFRLIGFFCFAGFALASAQTPGPVTPLPQAQVFTAQRSEATLQLVETPSVTRKMVDELLLAVTRKRTVAEAWKSLVTPADRIGIKVSTIGGSAFSSHRGVVNAIVAGLIESGVPKEKIIIWDRDSTNLREAGFRNGNGARVKAIDPPAGFDRNASVTAAVLGKLIWGDLLFNERARKPRAQFTDADQLSSSSFLPSILTKEVTKVINVPVLSDEASCGIAGAIYNMTISNIDNWRRFTQADLSASDGLATIYADERVGSKVVLHIMDGLVAQYAGGPGFNPNYAFAHNTIYASHDPVALDSVAARQIEQWRKDSKLASIANKITWLQTAEEMGLGQSAENRITIVPVMSPQ